MTLPHVDDDSDEEMEIVEEADQVGVQSTNAMHVGNLGTSGNPQPNTSESACDENEGCKDTDVIMEEEVSEQVDKHEIITFWLSVESQVKMLSAAAFFIICLLFLLFCWFEF
ncbi:hypothetical protein HYC85_008494 [Camellia sinensis]|uniref:Uncharacterized protein n=1 Tax=Camellia sinensis TaxID=4442 RepID=A0A7J7HUH7_CAMSI|nr:hypothetical protein HYC85_008494 [Camellia sinensis]